ncbi:GDSL-type esterase/lipase family protein [Haloimpatiens lingqiaonensis]|uniref:GDSL-type esterase/lipase family protein n=1 Tax=Haloimpatiens lingqiaonensis TaxID=1380675 RepID=UPI0010FEEAF4|nr:GDSL-type esterase/lipase family protein [Haloimpatiens lingqiaonensis]
MKVICIGDSLTYGFGVMKRHTWMEILKEKLKIDFVNRGINGDTTAGMLARSYEDIILNYPDKVIIMGGTNDFISGYNLKNVQENINLLAKEAKEHGIEPIIGIQIPTEPNMARAKWTKEVDYENVNSKIMNYREKIIEDCKLNGYKYIDFYKAFVEKIIENKDYRYYTDGIHPNYEGHKIMAVSAEKLFTINY